MVSSLLYRIDAHCFFHLFLALGLVICYLLRWPLGQIQAHLCRWETLLPVPLQPPVIVPVEEVCLGASRPHVWVNSYELQNSSSSAFFHANDDGIWQLFIPKLWITHGGAESVVPDGGHSQRRSLVDFQPRCLTVARFHIQRQDAGQGFPNESFFSISQGALAVEHRISWSLHDGIGRGKRIVAQIWQENGQHANGCSCEPVWEGKKTTEEEHACHLSMDSAWFAGWIAFWSFLIVWVVSLTGLSTVPRTGNKKQTTSTPCQHSHHFMAEHVRTIHPRPVSWVRPSLSLEITSYV